MSKGQLNLIRYAVQQAMAEPHGPCCAVPCLRWIAPSKVYQQSLRWS